MKGTPTIASLAWLFVFGNMIAEGQGKLATEHLLENVHNWREGYVYLYDGSKLAGLLRYDDNSGILTYQSGDVSKSLIAKSAAGFEFYDEAQGQQRYFFSREYDDGLSYSKLYFFEVLREFTNFTVLSKVDPIDIQVTSGSGPHRDPYTGAMYGGTIGSTAVEQTETIFIMDNGGVILPYLRIVEREVGGWLGGKSTRNKYVNRSLLETYTASHYGELKEYAKKEGLNLKRKADLLFLLDYYASLLQ